MGVLGNFLNPGEKFLEDMVLVIYTKKPQFTRDDWYLILFNSSKNGSPNDFFRSTQFIPYFFRSTEGHGSTMDAR